MEAIKLAGLQPANVMYYFEKICSIPHGSGNTKKISDYLTDRKVSGPERERQFVLLSGEDIVWVVGRRIDDRYRLTNETETVLRITRETI